MPISKMSMKLINVDDTCQNISVAHHVLQNLSKIRTIDVNVQ
jgi:hypothetical protein